MADSFSKGLKVKKWLTNFQSKLQEDLNTEIITKPLTRAPWSAASEQDGQIDIFVYFLYIFCVIFGSLIMPEKVATLKKTK